MGRCIKRGLDYFPLDVDFMLDIRIRKLIKAQRGQAVTVYTLLLCNVYKEGYYSRWDEELPFVVSEITGFEEAYIREVVRCCLRLGLFSQQMFDEYGVLTSRAIQERFRYICRMSRRACRITDYSLIDSEENNISSEEINDNSEEMPINSAKSTQIKGKERKEKENKPLSGERCACAHEAPAPSDGFEKEFNRAAPTEADIRAAVNSPEFLEAGATISDGRDFTAYYAARGWCTASGTPIRDWRAAFYSWVKKKGRFGGSTAPAPGYKPQPRQTEPTATHDTPAGPPPPLATPEEIAAAMAAAPWNKPRRS